MNFYKLTIESEKEENSEKLLKNILIELNARHWNDNEFGFMFEQGTTTNHLFYFASTRTDIEQKVIERFNATPINESQIDTELHNPSILGNGSFFPII